jgi:hypothetical protein
MAYSSLQEVHHRVMQGDVGDFWQSRHRQKVGLACDCLAAAPLSVKFENGVYCPSVYLPTAAWSLEGVCFHVTCNAPPRLSSQSFSCCFASALFASNQGRVCYIEKAQSQ